MIRFIENNLHRITITLVTLAVIGAMSTTALLLQKPLYVSAAGSYLERYEYFRFDTQEELEERRNQRDQAVADAQAAASPLSS